MKKILVFLSFFYVLNISAQQNYEWLKINQFRTATLGDSLKENSSLDFFKGKLLTLNDGGNPAELFEIDKSSGKIKKSYKTNLQNVDWEALASDSVNIYIGDIGNNVGARKDLVIYKVPHSDSLELDSIYKIPFFYPEQKNFTPQNLNTDFDAEAMIFLNGKIHLFTKEWISKSTTHYVIDPQIFENQPAQKIETYNIGFSVTDAAYFDGKLYLVGYTKKAEVFLTIFTETDPDLFFEQKPKNYYLGSALNIGQIEGITADEEGIYISGEEFIIPLFNVKPYLYFIPYEKIK
ncbi:hypothetical protein [Kaistella polysaccharea]|uniref:hypothetical protein n=1 Tax=Kaistella polysaccharea TaxID=2878534 RepID=UPI001CF0E1F9|nr:hypothetical protein [Kaistella polysaccharea]